MNKNPCDLDFIHLLILRDDAKRNSPMNVLDKIVSFSQNRSLIVAYGDHDPPEFHRQSKEMAEVSVTFTP